MTISNELTYSVDKWAQSIEGVQGERSGVNTANVGRL